MVENIFINNQMAPSFELWSSSLSIFNKIPRGSAPVEVDSKGKYVEDVLRYGLSTSVMHFSYWSVNFHINEFKDGRWTWEATLIAIFSSSFEALQ